MSSTKIAPQNLHVEEGRVLTWPRAPEITPKWVRKLKAVRPGNRIVDARDATRRIKDPGPGVLGNK